MQAPSDQRARAAYWGSDPIGLPLLDFLADWAADRIELVGVFTQPDRARGRGRKVVPGPVKAWAEARGIPVLQPEKPGPVEAAWMEERQIDLGLVLAYGHILRPSHLGAPRLGMINLHGSLLPKYRGASPIESAIAAGDSETGMSLMQMVPAMDAGPVADRERVPIGDRTTGGELREAMAAAAVRLVRRNLSPLLQGELAFEEQSETGVSYVRRLNRADGVLDFQAPATVLDRRIRALHPWPGTTVTVGDLTLKVGSAEAMAETLPGPPGRLQVEPDGGSLRAACGRGSLCFTALQRPGGNMLPIRDFLRGCPGLDGQVAESQPMPQLVSDRP
ncbi:MAG: methionyl-tRNA formyltransferase [Opitutales bacterium]